MCVSGLGLILLTSFLCSCHGKSLPDYSPLSPSDINQQSSQPQQGSFGSLGPLGSLAEGEGRGTGILNYEPTGQQDMVGPSVGVDVLDDGNSLENSLLNYLATRNMIRRMKAQIQASTLSQQQRKRNNGNYWKMCAFNAVSCFG